MKMTNEEILRNVRALAEKHRNDKVHTLDTDYHMAFTDIANHIEDQASLVNELIEKTKRLEVERDAAIALHKDCSSELNRKKKQAPVFYDTSSDEFRCSNCGCDITNKDYDYCPDCGCLLGRAEEQCCDETGKSLRSLVDIIAKIEERLGDLEKELFETESKIQQRKIEDRLGDLEKRLKEL